MSVLRREFLASMAATMAGGPWLWSQQRETPKNEREAANSESATPPGLDTLFLTWQGDPTTTMTIQWVGEAERFANTRVWYAPCEVGAKGAAAIASPADTVRYGLNAPAWQTAAVTAKPFLPTDWKVFRCELTGLTPGTHYQFRIGNEPAVHLFRTMPARMTDEFVFVSGGDAGVNAHVLANNALAARQDPQFVLITGDIAYDNGRSPLVTIAYLRNYSQTMLDSRGRMIPLVVGIGNHEVNGGYGKPRSAAPMYFSLFDGFYPETSYGVLDVGDYLSIVILDTGHVAKIEGEQTDWLAGVLKDRQERPHLIVANHVPAYPSYRLEVAANGKAGTGEGNRKHWCPLFERYNVDLVLEHHDHTFKRTHPLKDGLKDNNGVLYLGDGSWGKLRAPKPAEKKPYLAKASQAYHFTLHRLEEEQRFHVALDDTGKIMDVCRTAKKPRKRG